MSVDKKSTESNITLTDCLEAQDKLIKEILSFIVNTVKNSKHQIYTGSSLVRKYSDVSNILKKSTEEYEEIIKLIENSDTMKIPYSHREDPLPSLINELNTIFYPNSYRYSFGDLLEMVMNILKNVNRVYYNTLEDHIIESKTTIMKTSEKFKSEDMVNIVKEELKEKCEDLLKIYLKVISYQQHFLLIKDKILMEKNPLSKKYGSHVLGENRDYSQFDDSAKAILQSTLNEGLLTKNDIERLLQENI